MSPTAILAELRERGIELVAEGNQLRYRAPRGALTPDLREAMRQFKPGLLAVLTGRVPCLAPTEPLPDFKAEEHLYRLWWRTLPDKALARRMDGHLTYWARERGLSTEAAEGLRDRVRDLLG